MQKHVSLIIACLLSGAVVACGVTNTVNSPGASTTTTTGSSFPPTTTSTGSSFPPTGTGSRTPVAAGKVTITVQQTALHNGDIAATVQNGNASAIKVADHASNCTILTLQMQDGGNWTNSAACTSPTAPKLVDIAAGASLTVDLGTKALNTGATWSPGTYRLLIQFALGAAPAPGPADMLYTATSDTFTLG